MSKKRPKKVSRQEVASDKSPYVFQNDKINYELEIKELPWTEKQKEFIKIALSKETKVMIVKGSAGTSKTLISMYASLKLLNDKKVSDIILVRSAVESADSKLGFLPGDLNEKFSVYVTPFRDKLSELIRENDTKKLEKEGRLQICPINYARGLHWAAKCCIFDEAQNATVKEIETFLTRLGEFGKSFICGDPEQSDLAEKNRDDFSKICELFDTEEARQEGIVVFEFTDEDIMRSKLVRFVVKSFRKFQKKTK